MRGAILAGGLASRFGGRPKGLEKVGGERILDRVVRAVSAAVESPPTLIANPDDAKAWRTDLEIKPDVKAECGSLGGILTALSVGDGPVLVVAWDMPFVTTDLLKALVADWKSYDAYFPSSPGPLGLEPLCAVYGPTCLGPIRQSIEDEDYRTTAFHEGLRIGRIPLDEVTKFGDPETLFYNVNVPDDLERAVGLWRDQYEPSS